MDEPSGFCRQDPACPDHGKRGAGDLRVHGRSGKAKAYRLLKCRACEARSSEREGTPLFRSHLPEEKVVAVLEHLSEGCGVRQAERLVRAHRDTVMRYGLLAGEHAKRVHDEVVAFPPSDPRGPVR